MYRAFQNSSSDVNGEKVVLLHLIIQGVKIGFGKILGHARRTKPSHLYQRTWGQQFIDLTLEGIFINQSTLKQSIFEAV